MSPEELLLGIDIGTSSCKTILVDAAGGVQASARREYPIHSPRYGWAEQEPEDWFEALRGGLREIGERRPGILRRVAAVGVTGQMIGLVAADAEGRVLRPAIIWMDQRCLPQVERLQARCGDLIRRVALNPVNMAYTLPKMLWLKENEPQVWARLHKIQLPKDYLRLRLTGEWLMDYNDAAGTLLLDVAGLRWAEEIRRAAGIEADKLPGLAAGDQAAGRVGREAAAGLGLPEGVPVVAGAGDLAAENLAAGILHRGQMLTRMGTAGSSSTSTEAPLPDPKGISPCYPHCVRDRWLAEIADHTFGLCEKWFRDTFYEAERREAKEGGADLYEAMDRQAEAVPIGAEGLVFHPFNHAGPYWNPLLRGAFYGLSLRHTRAHLFRAMLEGSAFCLRDSILLLEERIQGRPADYRLVGGGSRSRLWTQIVCDILGRDARVLKTADASLGAAMLAGIGAGLFADPAEAIERCVSFEREVRADSGAGCRYAMFQEIYRRVHGSLMETSGLIHQAAGEE